MPTEPPKRITGELPYFPSTGTPPVVNGATRNEVEGVTDPGLMGDHVVPPNNGDGIAPTPNVFPALFRPENEEVTIPGPFFDGQKLTAVSGDTRTEVVVTKEDGDLVLNEENGAPYDFTAFVYDQDDRRIGFFFKERLWAPWEYEVNNKHIIELRGGKPHRLLAEIIPILGNEGLILTPHLTAYVTLEDGQQYEVQANGVLKSPRLIPLYLTQDFFENPQTYYNATTGQLTFPARGKHPAITIDLGIVGLPPPFITTGKDKFGSYRMIISWNDDPEQKYLIEIQGKIETGRSFPENLSLNLLGTTATGQNYQYSRNIAATADNLAEVITAYTRQQREPGLVLMAREAATHPAPGITRYAHLGTDYEQPGAPRRIDSWTELEGLIAAAIRVAPTGQAPVGQALEFEIEQRIVETLAPPADFLEGVTKLARDHPQNPITLVVHGHPIDPPHVTYFNHDGMAIATTKLDSETEKFWNTREIIDQILIHLDSHHDDALLLRTYFEVHEERPDSGQNEFLNAVIDRYNTEAAEVGGTLIPNDKRTSIYPWLERITNDLRDVVVATARANHIAIPPGALYDDRITVVRRSHPASDDPRRQVVLIDGGGAMGLALAAHIRRRMDRGELPLDIRIVGVDGYLPGVARLARDGTSASFTNPINLEGTLPLLVWANRLLIPFLQKYRPGTVFFTQKATRLAATKTDPALAAELAEINPAMPNPAKSLLPKVLIPYGAIRNGWLIMGKPKLAAREIVIGGYAKAEDVLEGSEDIFLVIAGENAEAIAQIRYLLGDHNIEYIVGAEMAEVIQAAGAFKNITTYNSGRRIMARALDQKGYPSSYDLQAFINGEVASNIELIEETIARVAPFQGMSTDEVSLPFGVIQDVIKCLDLNRNQLAEIRRRFESAVIAGNLSELDRLLDNITDEKIKLGGATRNPRDGYVDELLFWAYHALQPTTGDHLTQDILALAQKVKGKRLDETMTFEEFYQAHYPTRWKEQQRQEGRSGIDPLTVFEDEHPELTLPVTITMAAHAYARNNQRVSRPEHQRRELNSGDNPVWGLPAEAVIGFRDKVRLLNGALLRRTSHGEEGIRQVIRVGLSHLTRVLSPEIIRGGAYTEVNQKLIGIRAQMERLIAALKINHITEERAEIFIAATERPLAEVQAIFRDEVENTTTLIGRLRHIAQGLNAAEQALLTGHVPYRYTPAHVEGGAALPVARPTNVSQEIPVLPRPFPLEQSAEHFLNVSVPSPVYTPRKTTARHTLHDNHGHHHSIHPDLDIPFTPFFGAGESTAMETSVESMFEVL